MVYTVCSGSFVNWGKLMSRTFVHLFFSLSRKYVLVMCLFILLKVGLVEINALYNE